MMRWSRTSQPEQQAYDEHEVLAPLPALTTLPGWAALVEAAGGRCLRCGVAGELVAAFVRPLRLGGRATLANVQPLCEGCAWDLRGTGADYRRRGRAA